MDRSLVERMIGAVVLALLLIVLGPILLNGQEGGQSDPDSNTVELDLPVRVETIRVNGSSKSSATAKPPVAPPVQKTVTVAKKKAEPAKKKVEPVITAPPVVVAKAESPKQEWGVQIGSFSARENAERMAADLKKRGFSAMVRVSSVKGKSIYRVQVGPEPSRAKAEQLAGKLKAAGQNGMVLELGS
jgi:cell division septation protein DedD